MEEIKKYTLGGKEMLKIYAEGLLFNISPALGETLARYPVEGVVGDTLFPPIRVSRGPVGSIPIFAQADGRLEPTERAPGVEANLVGINVTSAQVQMRSRALATWIPIEYERGDDEAWDLRNSSALHLRGLLLLDKERKAAAAVNSPANVSSIFLPASAWNSGGNAIGNIEYLFSHVGSSGGLRPDRVAFGSAAWTSFASNSFAVSRCGGLVTPSRVAEVFRVSTVAISEARYNIGVGARSYAPIFPADVVVAFRAGNPDVYEARWGCSPTWRPGGFETGGRFLVELHPLSRRNQSTRVEVGTWETEAVVDSQLCAVLKGVNSAQGGGV